MSEETPDCLHIGGSDIKGYDEWDWVETVCDSVPCEYREGCRFYQGMFPERER